MSKKGYYPAPVYVGRFADGNTVRFFFSLNQIGHLRDFEASIRQLMSHLQTGESK